jgi:hypothetical protein
MEKVKTKKGCCEDKHHRLQVEKDQKAESRYQPEAPVAIAVITNYPTFEAAAVPSSLNEEYPVCNAPPPGKVPLCIRYCIFRI